MDAALPSWPGLGKRPSSGLIDLGSDRGRLGAAVPQDVTHGRQRRPSVPEIGRQRVPEDMGPLTRGCKASALQRAPHHRTDRDRVGAAPLGGLHAEEDTSGRTARAHGGESGPSSLANVLGHGETVAPSPCAANEQRARLPIAIVSRHRDDVARAQAETSHQEHKSVIALAGRMVLRATL